MPNATVIIDWMNRKIVRVIESREFRKLKSNSYEILMATLMHLPEIHVE